MNNQKEQVSSASLMFTIGCFIQSSTLVVGYITGVAKQDTWLTVIFGFIVALPIIWIFAALGEKFPGKNLIEINDVVFGKIPGKIISVLYIFFFFSLTFLNSGVMTDFVSSSLLPDTPDIAVLIMFIGVCGYAVRKGLETMTRYSLVFIIIVSVVLIINSLLLIKDMRLDNFQPSFTYPLKNYIQATNEVSILSFGNIVVFFMFFSSLKTPSQIKKPLFGGLIIGAATMIFISARDIAVLGPIIRMITIPAYDAVRLINLANTLTRMEILYAGILLMMLFFKISVLYYATVRAIAQIFNMKSYKLLVPVIGVLIIIFAYNAFDSSAENSYNAANIAPIYQTLFEVILPLVTLIVASIRGFRKPVGANI